MSAQLIASNPVLYGGLPLVLGALVALLLPTAFDFDPAGAMVKLTLGLLIASTEVVWLTHRFFWHPESRHEMLRDAVSCCVFVAAAVAGLAKWLEFTWTRSTAASDFAQDYLAAYGLWNNIEIYGPPLQQIGGHLMQWENYHPPFNAILFLPFLFFSYTTAFIVWNFVSLIIYIALVLVLLRSYGLLTFRSVRLSALLLLWDPFLGNIFLGQSSLPISALAISGFLLLRANRDRTAGLCFGLATLMKLYPGLIILYLLSQRKLRCVTVFVAVLGFGFLCSALLLGDAIVHYFRVVVPDQAELFATYPLNVSLGAAVRTIFEPTYFSTPLIWAPFAGDLIVLAVSGFIVGTMFLFAYVYRTQKFSADLFALFCIATLLVSPITWVHYCTLLLFPMAVLLHDAISRSCQASMKQLLWTAILCGVPLQDLIDGIREYYGSDQLAWYVILSVKTALYGMILLYCIFWQRLARSAGYTSAWQLLISLRLRLVRTSPVQ
jgi:uncharacterized membrane protein (DUF2068 family)